MSDEFSIEKNDVDILKLFEFKKEFKLQIPGGDEVSIWLKLPGDADMNKARTRSLRAGADLRAKLRDPKSDEALAMIPDAGEHSKEDIIEILLALITFELNKKYIKEVHIPYPTEPEEPDLESMEQYQKEVDAYGARLEEELIHKVLQAKEEERKRYNKLSKAKLIEEYKSLVISETVMNEFEIVYMGYLVMFSTYKDEACTKRLFESYEQYLNSPATLKDQLVQFVRQLNLSNAELKK